ncbi:MAG: adenylyltransferase/cytidyltransferase family protein [bacterium]|nr:adenylyltransferase/cytidyltransferase family protein [bacterium]
MPHTLFHDTVMAIKRRGKNVSFSGHVGTATPRLENTSKVSLKKGAYGKVLPFADVLKIARAAKKSGLTVVSTNGCFDILHIGHVRNLKTAKSYGDMLVVGVNSDSSVRRNKGNSRPIIPERERAEVVASLKSVDAVFIFDENTPDAWIKKLKPDVHAKGQDRTAGQIVEKKMVEAGGGRLVLIPLIKGHSTTAIIARMRALQARSPLSA